jgi:hypothetical protein
MLAVAAGRALGGVRVGLVRAVFARAAARTGRQPRRSPSPGPDSAAGAPKQCPPDAHASWRRRLASRAAARRKACLRLSETPRFACGLTPTRRRAQRAEARLRISKTEVVSRPPDCHTGRDDKARSAAASERSAWRLRPARSGERIANPRAATAATATAAGHPESTEQAFNSS